MSLQSEQEKTAFKKRFRNFPTFPKELPEKKSKEDILFECFPWGCEYIRNPSFSYDHDSDFSECIILQNCTNVCLSVKYGICTTYTNQFAFLYDKFCRMDRQKENLYIKLYSNNYSKPTLNAIGRVVGFEKDKTFRFWKFTCQGRYKYGIMRVQYLAIGEIQEDMPSSEINEEIFNYLQNSKVNWTDFRVSDEFQWERRRSCIKDIEESKDRKSFQKKQRQKHKQFLEEVEAKGMKMKVNVDMDESKI